MTALINHNAAAESIMPARKRGARAFTRRAAVAVIIALLFAISPGAGISAYADDAADSDLKYAELAQAYQDQAAVAFGMGEPEIAARLYRDAASLFPESPEIYYRLAVVLESMGEIEEAINAYEVMKQAEPDGRWAGLARARLDVLRTRAAMRALMSAEQMRRAGGYSEAKRILRQADQFSPATPVKRRIYERYYSYLSSSIASQINSEMRRRAYSSIAIVGFESPYSEDRTSADYFAQMLRNYILAETRLEVLSGLVVRDSLLSIRMPVISEEIITEYPYFDFQINPVDCMVAGIWREDELEVILYDMRNGEAIMSRVIPLIGVVPPRHPALIWQRFPAPRDTNPDLWVWVWPASELGSSEQRSIRLNIQVSQPSYVTLFLVMSDGSLDILIPSSSEPESYLRERQPHTIEVPAGQPGEVRGVWMIASRTSLFSWGANHAGSESAHEALDWIIAELPGLPRRSWDVARWTWYVEDPQSY